VTIYMQQPPFPMDGRTPNDNVRWLLFKNDSGYEVPAHGVMAMYGDDPFGDEADDGIALGRPILHCVQVTPPTFNRILAVNGPFSVPVDGYGQCTVMDGPVLALSSTGGLDVGRSLGSAGSSFVLNGNIPGFTVVGYSTSQLQWVQPQPVDQLIGVLDEELYFGGHATVSIYFGPGNGETDSDFNVEGYDWLLCTGEHLNAGSKVVLQWINGYWYVTESRYCAY